MKIKILQTEEVPKAVQLARGVFEYCLRNTINEAQLIESFYSAFESVYLDISG